MKKTILVVLYFIICIFICSCNKENRSTTTGCYGYDESVFEIDNVPDMNTNVSYYSYHNGVFYLTVVYDNEDEVYTDVYLINEDGTLNSNTYFDGNQTPDGMINDNFLYLSTDKTLVEFNPVTGEVINTNNVLNGEDVLFVRCCNDYIFVFEDSKVIIIDSNGNVISEIEDSSFGCNYDRENPVFFDNGYFYIVVLTNEDIYMRIDTDNNAVDKVYNSIRFADNPNNCHGKYYYNIDGNYRIDLENSCLVKVSDWNMQNMKPESKCLSLNLYETFDDSHFGKIYLYSDGSVEMLMYTYNPEIDYSDKTLIKIGGFGVNDNLSARWCKYLFNQNNDDYKIVFEDYSEKFGSINTVDANEQQLKLIQYFSEGNAPDIFYGDVFDYDYMGRNNSIVDISKYLKDSDIYDNFSDSTKNLIMNSDGTCYQIYTEYTLMGYVGLKSKFPSSNVSWDELSKMITNIRPFSGIRSFDIVDQAVKYSLYDIRSEGKLTNSNIERIVDYSYKYGISATSDERINDVSSLKTDDYLLALEIFSDIYSYASAREEAGETLTFVGYPSIDESIHLVRPFGLFAISSSTENPDKCWEAISFMFDESVQRSILFNQGCPTDEKVLLDYLDNLTDSMNPEVSGGIQITKQIVEEYLDVIHSVDTVERTDWGVHNIIWDEVDSYYSDNKNTKQIADSIVSRLSLYISENGD